MCMCSASASTQYQRTLNIYAAQLQHVSHALRPAKVAGNISSVECLTVLVV